MALFRSNGGQEAAQSKDGNSGAKRDERHRLVTQVLGGPANYDGRPLAEAHAGLGIDHDGVAVAATESDIVESGSSWT